MPGPAEAPETPVRGAFQRRAARTARPASPHPSPAPRPLAPHPHGRKSPATREPTPTPYSRGAPRPALPARPADLRDGRRERLLRRGADEQRLEKCQSQGQQAASSHLRDRRSMPPPCPSGGRSGAGNRGRRKSSTRRRDRASGGPAAPGARGAEPRGGRRGRERATEKGRWRADPLARVGCSAPWPPCLRRHQGRLWKQTSASPPALARSRSPSRFPP